MKDIAPELLENIQKSFDEKFDSSKKIEKIYEKVKEGIVDYDDAQSFAKEVGKILSEAFQNNLSSDKLPDGRLYYNIANRIIPEMLKLGYELVSKVAVEVLNIVNESAGIGIKAKCPNPNKERMNGIVDIVSGKLIYDQIAYMLKDPVIHYCQCAVDDTVHENADFQHKSGRSPKIIRTSTGECCEWCEEVASEYDYADAKKNPDVFRRHKHCDCKVEYVPGDGRRQNVHDKAWSGEVEAENERKSELIRRLAFSEANRKGYNPISEEKVVNVLREKSKQWIEKLTDYEKNDITKYTFNGIDDDGKRLFEKINRYLTNSYIPIDEKEENMILNFYTNIKGAILKNELEDDIIVYRREYSVASLKKKTAKFLSTSVTVKGALGGDPNIAIIVPKGTEGAYIELLSRIPKQREFLLNEGMILNEILSKDGIIILEVIKNEGI